MAYDASSLIRSFQIAEARARAANIKREQELRGMYEKVEERYQPGGAFEVSGKAEIERAKVKSTGQEMQQLISSGMYGTTTAAGIPSRWEAEVGMPARSKLEDISMGRLTQAEMAKAGFIERIQEPYPDYGPLMQAIQAASAVPRRTSAAAQPPHPYMGTLGPATITPQASSAYGQVTQPTTATRQPVTVQPTAVPDFTTPVGYGAVQPLGGTPLTKAQQFTVRERLKAMYPQMTQPGWGTPAPAKPKTSLWSSISSAVLGRPF